MLTNDPVLCIANVAKQFSFSLGNAAPLIGIKELKRLGHPPYYVSIHNNRDCFLCCCLANIRLKNSHPRIKFINLLYRRRKLEADAGICNYTFRIAKSRYKRRFRLSDLERGEIKAHNHNNQNNDDCNCYIFHFLPLSLYISNKPGIRCSVISTMKICASSGSATTTYFRIPPRASSRTSSLSRCL